MKLDPFTRQYVETALCWSIDENDNHLDQNYSTSDIATETIDEMVQDCTEFQRQNAELLEHADDIEHAAHDFWLTRNGHGTGFWDSPNRYGGEENAEALTDAAHAFGGYD